MDHRDVTRRIARQNARQHSAHSTIRNDGSDYRKSARLRCDRRIKHPHYCESDGLPLETCVTPTDINYVVKRRHVDRCFLHIARIEPVWRSDDAWKSIRLRLHYSDCWNGCLLRSLL